MRRVVKFLVPVALLSAVALALAACGTERINVAPQFQQGAQLFSLDCSGCHTLKAAATHGSASNIQTRERVDGPNFNLRAENVPSVLFAIRNGGFSGAIMPQNIAVGQQAQVIAAFVARYAGADAANAPDPKQTRSGGG